jgi:hypothetical protein
MRTIDLKTAIVHLRDDGILHLHIKSHAEVDMTSAKEILKAMRMLGGGLKYPVLIEAGELARIDPEVRIFSASAEGNIYTLADAVAYESLAQKLIARFYLAHDKPVVPTEIFPDQAEAIEWLRRFVQTV